jgi:hypothetical protein
MTDYRALCAELLNGLDEQQHPDYPWPGYTLAAMDRARTALAQSQSEQGGDPLESFISQCRPLDDETAALLTPDVRWRLYDESGDPTPQPEPAGELPDSYIDPGHSDADRELLEAFYLAARSEGGTADEIHLRGIQAAIALALSRAPAQPADGEAEELAQWLHSHALDCRELGRNDWARQSTNAATLLQHLQPPHPVAVSERPWEREGWVNGDDECWIGYPSTTYAIADTGDYDTTACEWRLEAPPSRPEVSNCVALPFHALPIPTTPPEAQ